MPPVSRENQAGSAIVELQISADRANREVEAFVRQTRTTAVAVMADMQSAEASASEFVKETAARKATVPVDADTTAYEAKLAKLQSAQQQIRKYTIDADVSAAESKLKKLSADQGAAFKKYQADLARLDEIRIKTKEVTLSIDVARAEKEFAKLGDAASEALKAKLDSVGQKITGIGKMAAISISAPIGVAFGLSAKAASDLNERMNATNQLFGEGAQAIHEFAESANGIGLAKTEAEEFAGSFANLLRQTGAGSTELANMSTNLVTLTADIGSFLNKTNVDVSAALQSGLAGETEALRKLGIIVDDNAKKQYAMQNGFQMTGKELTQQQKILATYGLILQQTGPMQGDFARTLGSSMPNAAKAAKADLTNLAAEVGTKLVPFQRLAFVGARDLLKVFGDLPAPVQNVALGFGTVAAAAGPVLVTIGKMSHGVTSLIEMWGRYGPAARAAAAANAASATSAAQSAAAELAEAAAVKAATIADTEQAAASLKAAAADTAQGLAAAGEAAGSDLSTGSSVVDTATSAIGTAKTATETLAAAETALGIASGAAAGPTAALATAEAAVGTAATGATPGVGALSAALKSLTTAIPIIGAVALSWDAMGKSINRDIQLHALRDLEKAYEEGGKALSDYLKMRVIFDKISHKGAGKELEVAFAGLVAKGDDGVKMAERLYARLNKMGEPAAVMTKLAAIITGAGGSVEVAGEKAEKSAGQMRGLGDSLITGVARAKTFKEAMASMAADTKTAFAEAQAASKDIFAGQFQLPGLDEKAASNLEAMKKSLADYKKKLADTSGEEKLASAQSALASATEHRTTALETLNGEKDHADDLNARLTASDRERSKISDQITQSLAGQSDKAIAVTTAHEASTAATIAISKATADYSQVIGDYLDAKQKAIDAETSYQQVLRETEGVLHGFAEGTKEAIDAHKTLDNARLAAREAVTSETQAELKLTEVKERQANGGRTLVELATAEAEARDKAAQAAKEVTSAENALTDAKKGVGAADRNVISAGKELTASRQEASKAAANLADVEAKAALVLRGYGEASQQAATATRELAAAQRSARSAQLDLADSQDSLAEVQERLANSGLTNVELVRKQAEDAKRAIEQTKQIAAAETHLAEVRVSSADKVAKAQARLVEVQGSAASKIASAQSSSASKIASANDRIARSQDEIARAQREVFTATDALTKAQVHQQQVLNGYALTTREAISAIRDLARAQRSGQSAELDNLDAIDALTEAQAKYAATAGLSAAEQDKAYRALQRAQIAAAEAEDRLAESREAASVQGDKTNEVLHGAKEGSDSYKAAMDEVASATEKMASIQERVASAQQAIAEANAEAAQAAAEGAAAVTAAMTEQDAAIADAQAAITAAIADQQTALDEAQASLDAAKTRTEESTATTFDREKAERAVERALIALANAQDSVVTSQDAAAAAALHLDEVVNGAKPGTDAYKAAQDSVAAAHDAVTAAGDRVTASMQAVTDATTAATEAANKVTEAEGNLTETRDKARTAGDLKAVSDFTQEKAALAVKEAVIALDKASLTRTQSIQAETDAQTKLNDTLFGVPTDSKEYNEAIAKRKTADDARKTAAKDVRDFEGDYGKIADANLKIEQSKTAEKAAQRAATKAERDYAEELPDLREALRVKDVEIKGIRKEIDHLDEDHLKHTNDLTKAKLEEAKASKAVADATKEAKDHTNEILAKEALLEGLRGRIEAAVTTAKARAEAEHIRWTEDMELATRRAFVIPMVAELKKEGLDDIATKISTEAAGWKTKGVLDVELNATAHAAKWQEQARIMAALYADEHAKELVNEKNKAKVDAAIQALIEEKDPTKRQVLITALAKTEGASARINELLGDVIQAVKNPFAVVFHSDTEQAQAGIASMHAKGLELEKRTFNVPFVAKTEEASNAIGYLHGKAIGFATNAKAGPPTPNPVAGPPTPYEGTFTANTKDADDKIGASRGFAVEFETNNGKNDKSYRPKVDADTEDANDKIADSKAKAQRFEDNDRKGPYKPVLDAAHNLIDGVVAAAKLNIDNTLVLADHTSSLKASKDKTGEVDDTVTKAKTKIDTDLVNEPHESKLTGTLGGEHGITAQVAAGVTKLGEITKDWAANLVATKDEVQLEDTADRAAGSVNEYLRKEVNFAKILGYMPGDQLDRASGEAKARVNRYFVDNPVTINGVVTTTGEVKGPNGEKYVSGGGTSTGQPISPTGPGPAPDTSKLPAGMHTWEELYRMGYSPGDIARLTGVPEEDIRASFKGAGAYSNAGEPPTASGAVPTVKAPTGPYHPGQKLTASEILGLVQQAGFTGETARVAAAIALAESAGIIDDTSPPNRNGTRDHGLFQFNDGGTLASFVPGGTVADANDPRKAAAGAYKLWHANGNNFYRWYTYDPPPGFDNLSADGKKLYDSSYQAKLRQVPGGTGTPPPTGSTTSHAMDAMIARLKKGASGGGTRPDAITGFTDQFTEKLYNLFMDDSRLGVFSGYRSTARQAQIFAEKVKQYGSYEAARHWAAPPGHSRHEHGDAADLTEDGGTLRSHGSIPNVSKYGLYFPMTWEPWHIQDIASQEARDPTAGEDDVDSDRFARGIYATRATRGILGEDGPEVVLPLTRPHDAAWWMMRAAEQYPGAVRRLMDTIDAAIGRRWHRPADPTAPVPVPPAPVIVPPPSGLSEDERSGVFGRAPVEQLHLHTALTDVAQVGDYVLDKINGGLVGVVP